MKYKAIFSDFDGTMIGDSYNPVSKENIDAIKKYVEKGGKFFLSTGRLFQSIYPHIEGLGVESDLAIVAQGAEIYDVKEKKLLKQWVINLEDLRKITDFVCSEFGNDTQMTALMYLNNEVYFMDRNRDIIQIFCDIVKVEPHIIDCRLDEYCEKLGQLPTKVIVLASEEYMETFMANGRNAIGSFAQFCRSRPFLVEIMPYGVNKGEAVKAVCEKYGIMLDDVICIGDSENDLSMIEVAGLGVATDNAFDSVKAISKYVSKHCDEHALADVINKFCLGD